MNTFVSPRLLVYQLSKLIACLALSGAAQACKKGYLLVIVWNKFVFWGTIQKVPLSPSKKMLLRGCMLGSVCNRIVNTFTTISFYGGGAEKIFYAGDLEVFGWSIPSYLPSSMCSGHTVHSSAHCRPTVKQYSVPTVRAVHTLFTHCRLQCALCLHCGNYGLEPLRLAMGTVSTLFWLCHFGLYTVVLQCTAAVGLQWVYSAN